MTLARLNFPLLSEGKPRDSIFNLRFKLFPLLRSVLAYDIYWSRMRVGLAAWIRRTLFKRLLASYGVYRLTLSRS